MAEVHKCENGTYIIILSELEMCFVMVDVGDSNRAKTLAGWESGYDYLPISAEEAAKAKDTFHYELYCDLKRAFKKDDEES